MNIILDSDIRSYCEQAGMLQRALDDAQAQPSPPAYTLPIFEICRFVYFDALRTFAPPGAFVECWNSFLGDYWQRPNAEALLHLALSDDELEATNILRRLIETPLHHGVQPAQPARRDPRNRDGEHTELTARLRELQSRISETFSNEERRRYCVPPDCVSENAFDGIEVPAGDLVLDTNIFIEVLNQLRIDDQLRVTLSLSDRIHRSSAQIERVLRDKLAGFGSRGKLIVPICVLEEAHRVINKPEHDRAYRRARALWQQIMLSYDAPRWSGFAFQPLTLNTLDALLYLCDQLIKHETHVDDWPDFGDALVLAHALSQPCRLVSTEWTEKAEWVAVRRLVPALVFE